MTKIEKIARLTLAWALFWLGHAVSKIMDGPQAYVLYPVYSRLMCASNAVQGAGPGPWSNTILPENADGTA